MSSKNKCFVALSGISILIATAGAWYGVSDWGWFLVVGVLLADAAR